MKICIDGIGITLLKGTGLYSHTYETLNNLFELYPQPKYEIICDGVIDNGRLLKNRGVKWLNLKLKRGEIGNNSILNYIKENKVSLFHSLNNGFSIPNRENKDDKCRYICTVHDVIAASNSELVDKKYLNRFQQVFPSALMNADRIVAVSEFIKNEIIKYYGINEDKVHVIYPGCGEQFRNMDYGQCSKFLKEIYKIEGDIILYSGSIHVRKNLRRLLHIFKEISKLNNEIKLVIVGKIDGKRYNHYQELKQLVSAMELENKVHFTGNVEYDHMQYFYNAAKCYVNLSEYEGFPMSAIEALCCGTPVICSNNTSFKEIIKNDGILLYNENEGQIRDMILDVIQNGDYKNQMIENSIAIRNRLNWQTNIKKHVYLYESLYI